MNRLIKMITVPRIGLIYRETFVECIDWLKENENEIIKHGGIINKMNNEIKFPNGNKLILSFGDLEKFIGCEFLFVDGTKELDWKIRK